MKHLLAIAALLVASLARAGVVVVTEESWVPIPGVPPTERQEKKEVATVFLEVASQMETVSKMTPRGTRLSTLSRYAVKEDSFLWCGSIRVCPAGEVLAQVASGSSDLVIFRRNHNSFSSPLKLLRAFVGHPIQIDEIWAMRVKDGTVLWSQRLVAKSAVWKFRVEIYGEPNQSLEPTTVLGTSAAEQPLVPSTLVAHL